MARVDVMVVEDEAIVAKDIKRQLTRFGYGVAALASSGEEAVEKAAQMHPDLVLMDIRLKGELDGVQATQAIRRQSDIPVVYLTAYADDHTLERAKATEPSGYLLKPFEGRELQMAIEIAVRQHRSGRVLRQHLFATLRCRGDGLIIADPGGCVTFLSPLAEVLTGWESARAIGKPLPEVFRVIGRQTQNATPSIVSAALRVGAHHAVRCLAATLVAEDGAERYIEYRAAPLCDEAGIVTGVVVVFCDTMRRERATQKLLKDRGRLQALLKERMGELSRANGQLKKDSAQRDLLQRALDNKDVAMKEILHHIELEKKEIHDQVLASVDHLVMPIVRKLKMKGTSSERGHLELLERSLNELTAPFGANMQRQLSRLSPREIEMCNVLKSGLTSKEIGSLLNISPLTVERHRNNIRRKIGIHNQKINLTTYLQAL